MQPDIDKVCDAIRLHLNKQPLDGAVVMSLAETLGKLQEIRRNWNMLMIQAEPYLRILNTVLKEG